MSESHASQRSNGSALGPLLAAMLGVIVNLLIISDAILHHPEDYETPLGHITRFFDTAIVAPLATVLTYFGEVITSSSSAHFAPITSDSPHVLASAILGIFGIVCLYGATVALLKLYDAFRALNALQEVAAVVLTLFSLPLAAMAIVHIVKVRWHINLVPYADNLIRDYRLVVHSGVDAFYWLPLHFFTFTIPMWLKDVAAVSTVSVGMFRKAAFRSGEPGFITRWDELLEYIGRYPFDDVFDVVEYLPTMFSAFVATIVGFLIRGLSFGRSWFAERVSAAVFVIIRGLLLLGISYFLCVLWYSVRGVKGTPEEVNESRRGIKMYWLYMVLTVVLVVWFLWAFQWNQYLAVNVAASVG